MLILNACLPNLAENKYFCCNNCIVVSVYYDLKQLAWLTLGIDVGSPFTT